MSKKIATPQALALAEALSRKGLKIEIEHWDGHKHVDIYIPEAKMYIEVDGLQHETRDKSIVSDLTIDYYSFKNGFFTKRFTNEIVEHNLNKIVNAIFKTCRDLKNQNLTLEK